MLNKINGAQTRYAFDPVAGIGAKSVFSKATLAEGMLTEAEEENIEWKTYDVSVGGPAYDRSAFGGWQPGIREQVLERDNYMRYYPGCKQPATTVDHVISLKDMWDAGASTWTDEERNVWFNNPDNLSACCSKHNSSKGAQGLIYWMARIIERK